MGSGWRGRTVRGALLALGACGSPGPSAGGPSAGEAAQPDAAEMPDAAPPRAR